MRAALVIPAIVTLLLAASSAQAQTGTQSGGHNLAQCSCAADKARDGWCGKCNVGHVAGVKIRSRKLYDAVAGKPITDASRIKCATCAAACKNGGYCAHCKVGFAGKKMYESRVGCRLARGQAKDPAKMKCPRCKAAAADHGWCKMCGQGLVHNVAYRNRSAYQQAVQARATLQQAAMLAEKCEGCAVAMVTDGTCSKCNVSFKDGKPQTKMGGVDRKAKP